MHFRTSGRAQELLGALCVVFACVCSAPAADEEPGMDEFYSGNSLYNKKLYPLAIAEYRAFLQKYPQHSKIEEARLGLALSLYAAADYKEADPLIGEVLKAGKVGDKTELALMHAHCALMLDRFDDARKLFEDLIGAKLNSFQRVNALAGLAETAFRRKDWKGCAEWGEKLLAFELEPALRRQSAYQVGYALYELKKYAAAAAALGKMGELEKADPLLPRAAYLRAECFRESGKLPEAAEQYAAASAVMSGEAAAEVFYRLGHVSFQQDKFDDAIAAFGKSVQAQGQGPLAEQCNLFIGRAWLEKKDYNRAKQHLEGLSRGNSPLSPAAALWLARVYSRQGQQNEAAGVLGQALQRFADADVGPDLVFDHANALIAQNKFAEAAKTLGSAHDKKDWTRHNDVLRLCCVCLHKSKDYKSALQYADEFIAAYKDDKSLPEVLFVRGESLYLLGELDKAMAALKKYLETAPTHANADAATFRIAQILHRQGKWSEAIGAAEPLVKKDPKDDFFAQLKFLVGECHFRRSDWPKATAHLKDFERESGPRREARKRQGRDEPDENLDTALLELGVAALGAEDSAAASGYFAKVVQQYASSRHMPLALAELGRLQYLAKDNGGARGTFDRFLREHSKAPQRPQVEYYYGWLSLAENRVDEAAGHFGVVADSYPGDRFAPDAALQRGLILEEKGLYKETQTVFENIVKTYTNHPNMDLAVFALGVACARQQDWENAKRQFTKIVDDFPKSKVADRAVYELAWCEKGMNKRDEAAKRYEYLLERYPKSELVVKVKTELAEEQFATRDYAKVISGLKEALEKVKDEKTLEQSLYRLGTAYFSSGDHENSAKTFEDFLKKYGNSPLRGSAYFQAGESRLERKELDAARAHFAGAVQSHDQKLIEPALFRLGQVEALRKDWTASENAFTQFLQRFSESKWATEAHFGLGRAREERKNHAGALPEYRKVVDAGSRGGMAAEAQCRSGVCLTALKKYDEALQALVRVQVVYGDKEWSARALYEMGLVLEAKGEKERAIEQFKQVVEQFPGEEAAKPAKERLKALGI